MKNPHAVALGKKGGAATSPAKQAAARRNGRKGGRPRDTADMTIAPASGGNIDVMIIADERGPICGYFKKKAPRGRKTRVKFSPRI